MLPTLSVLKVPLEVPHDWGTTRFTTDMHLLDPIFKKRRSPLDPESSRTLIVLFLTYSPKLLPKSGSMAQSEHVFLLFSFKLVLFSSNFFNLGANFFGIWPFLNFWERFRDPWVFSWKKLALSAFWQEGLSFPRLALRNLHLFLKNAHYCYYRSHLSGFCGLFCNFISLCSYAKGCINKFDWTGLVWQIDRV